MHKQRIHGLLLIGRNPADVKGAHDNGIRNHWRGQTVHRT
ncbi:hypothetical protein ALP99_102565 [Pseudomonas syringae pv. tomato]|uniref:Uncharacterized protein n=3 Tax=Pseudomonas syringae group genomosp. 3 TaxID=251701 RepID=A0A3M3RY92_9PSED|nr:hypothetical protein ALO88_102670 [Pseudomonas syringae pv. antirrhini]KPY21796.1 hypothetical protein ALO54_102446 [Pseudomonas syringae pv. philadelphi]RMM78873.1 hypothetical protein ALQ72_100846 [Pseudomonas syringae pv. maculicola]RMN48078.1 hypothetical protein ALQ58_102436 [Pseudomonas syringae pv. apii]RMQ40484.1 hypothetical protein ALQ06_102412 [Pseudomonas syringae pv. berberidis]RMQ70313.1 hypothetical protein ALP99_102565 [Pseudomonas syringae pv. tomato]RMR29843.1 hypothetica